MKTVTVVYPAPGSPGAGVTFAVPAGKALEQCFQRRGWKVRTTTEAFREPPDLIAGYGWRPVMRQAHRDWPERVLHGDLGFWSREQYLKLALGDRWSPLTDRDYDDSRLKKHGVTIAPSRPSGKRMLVCGMSAKAAGTWDLRPEEWERDAVRRLVKAGATVTYRPKPSWPDPTPISGSKFDRGGGSIEAAIAQVDAVVSHHSNTAIDALAAGLPIYVETGIAKTLSVPTLEDAVHAQAPDLDTRSRFLRQVSWHQWNLRELAEGVWLKPPAPLADQPLFC